MKIEGNHSEKFVILVKKVPFAKKTLDFMITIEITFMYIIKLYL